MLIGPRALRVIKAESIEPQELSHMIKTAAVTSLRGFNRRYHHWLLKITGAGLEDMEMVDLIEIGSGEDAMMETHEDCDGAGCHECGWVGSIVRKFSAPVY